MVNYYKDFDDSLSAIGKLIDTPNLMQSTILGSLDKFETNGLKEFQKQKFEHIKQVISNISLTSLKSSYNIIYNQLCILSVSSLSAILEKYFINYVNSHWHDVANLEGIRLTLEEIRVYNFDLKASLGRIILENDNSIKFQDLKSILRSFKNYFNKHIELDKEAEKYIIFYQHSRHILVHNDGKVNQEFLKKVGDANLKNYQLGDKIQLDSHDWEQIQKYFRYLVHTIIPPLPANF